MNIHHLELFYYVARNEGISRAVEKMPYGIQQPAISGQLLKLEKFLGVKLFNRRPFVLTPAGQELLQFITPFFSNMGLVSQKIRDGMNQHLRIAAASTVLRDHFPELLKEMKQEFPKLKLTLRELTQSQAESLIQNQEIDLAISGLEKEPSATVQSSILIQLPMVLIVKKNSTFDSVKSFSSQIFQFSLISTPSNSILYNLFQSELRQRNIPWQPAIEVDSLDLVRAYVSNGFGVGLSVRIPKVPHASDMREIPLKGFPKLRISAFWQGELSALSKRFLELVKTRAQQLMLK